jgi:hypothetical protein
MKHTYNYGSEEITFMLKRKKLQNCVRIIRSMFVFMVFNATFNNISVIPWWVRTLKKTFYWYVKK